MLLCSAEHPKLWDLIPSVAWMGVDSDLCCHFARSLARVLVRLIVIGGGRIYHRGLRVEAWRKGVGESVVIWGERGWG